MNILYCGDENIENGLVISTLSLLKNVKEELHIYVLTMNIQNEKREFKAISDWVINFLDERVKKENEKNFIKKIDITEMFKEELPIKNMETRFTPYCMLRLFVDKIPEIIGRILYLDTDVVCRKDCSEFYNQDVSKNELIGVLDYYGKWFFKNNIFKFDYINSGVLLLNLTKIRETKLFEKCRKMCREEEMFMPDQSAINKLSTAKKIVERKYNEQRKLHKDTVFQHFTTSFRFFPWFHALTIKPWHIERVHNELKIREYDDIFEEYRTIIKDMELVRGESIMIPKKEIPIFFTIDNSYAPYISVAIKSIIENASKDYNYKLIVLHQELNEENIEKISSLSKEGFEIKFVYMKDGLETITDRVENRLRCDYFTLTIYFRLFIPDMFPEYDKGIYIDSDVVVPGDISKLYNHELGNNLIGACSDNSVVDVPELAKYMEEAVGVSRYEYVNSGVLLMNLKEMREKEFTKKFLSLLNKYHFDCIAPDQDYLNAMCNGKILYLDEGWDAMPTEGKEPLLNPNLIHYNLFQKPWCYDNIQYEEYFWKYAKQTKYYEPIVQFKNNYSEEQKQSDRECLGVLVSKGGKMSDKEVTFKKVMESGEKIRI